MVLTAPAEDSETVLAGTGFPATARGCGRRRWGICGWRRTIWAGRSAADDGDLSQIVPFYLQQSRDGLADIVVERVSARQAAEPLGADLSLSDLEGCGPEGGA